MKKTILEYKRLKYVFSTPDDFSKDKKYPVIIFLHGAGSRGVDIAPLVNNPYFTATNKLENKAVTFAPQCYADSWFDIFEQLQDFVKYVLENKFVDKDRVYLMGASMGGYATWQLSMTMPEYFAAIAPICGGGMYWNVGRIKDVKIWAFHGDMDDCVKVEESIKMVDAVNKCGGDAKLTICEGIGHDSWNVAYNSKELFDWLLEQRRGVRSDAKNEFDDQIKFG